MNEWEHAESIANLPLVHEALQGFAEDPTGSNGTIIVREVVRVIFSNPKPEYIKLDEEWKKCHGCINGEGTHSISCPERKSPAQEPVRKQLETAVNRINDLLQNDDGQAHKEARKFIESLSAQKGTEHGTS